MSWSSASSARVIATGTASRSLLTRHTRADTVGTQGPSRADGTQGRETDLQNLRSRHVRHSPAKLLLLAMEGCLFQKAERKLPLQPKSSPIATEFVPARTQGCHGGDDLDVAHQNSSREDPPEYASAAWDHWTGRDCAAGRPSRSLCLDLTSGPPLASASFALAPDPLSMDTESPIHVPRRA